MIYFIFRKSKKLELRTDLHLTSTGKGHFYEREKPFPPANFRKHSVKILFCLHLPFRAQF